MTPQLSVTHWSVLGVIAEGTTHGFAVSRELGPDAALGRIWTVRRSLVYRAIADLIRLGMVEEVGPAAGAGGPRRTLVRATPKGRRVLRQWLDRPVEHVRDVRSLLLLKLALLDRSGRDIAPLVTRQRQAIEPLLHGLRGQLQQAEGFEALLARWRVESADAVGRFLAGLRD